ncbi:alanine--tRNA ligase [Dasania sp. GY-MA-18]|uniref:Alanine--tRNA ligase n=1 Tax=Dasania phycosphaerae TaxID=2950436 RepID=A0A9J6RSQ2_9GAMM|nr:MULTISPECIES: alanine--tRNA ligase [Dasania]MCR8924442.1 alanine--tRNA ligase [Dasania sp. GY-MA-18]MCZ0867117.1 alanine--tRNA ligase [Dasania phycosphaerae]MCZ0870569.1 alanine--tRNA ligase [Dasania phycosphaerae]
MKSSDIREAFLSYFEQKGHARVASSSLVPGNDPTLLFTNAGMVQFKDLFLGQEQRAYSRATSSQRCVRAGGKHNDLENVGYTARHHTFFEMLGNFSFGDYFKKDAIAFAWEFLTSEQYLNLPTDKLLVTVYADDDEAYNIWLNDMGLPAEKIIRIGDNKGAKYASDNFWAMGDTGPCGPCTEIFYDHGEEIFGGPPGSPDEDGDRFIEIWNNVFMQYNRSEDGTMHPLPKPSVDTGMGLERISAIMQGVHSNYEIDLFQSLLNAAAKIIGVKDTTESSLRVIADHIRSCSFLICDGVLPSNEGRGYVLRRIIRRAVRHGNKLGAKDNFFHKLVAPLAQEMGDAYPELVKLQAQIEKVLLTEEEQFAKTLDQGMRILEQDLAGLSDKQIPGEILFKLYDTYGFPVDLTGDIARERGLTIDEAGFEAAMENQRQMARASSNFKMTLAEGVDINGSTEFTGYQQLADDCEVVALLKDGELVDSLAEGETGAVVLASTPFYGESGGQVGDSGLLTASGVRFEVADTSKNGDNHLHQGVLVQGSIKVGDNLAATVDAEVRHATALNHSATHLLHAALRNVLGDHVQQKGSLVDAQKLRFDFSHFEAVTAEQLKAIEQQVNEQIRLNSAVETTETDMENAEKLGAMMLFGEKYGDSVRVLSMGQGYSVELCGGTHVKRTGDIGLIRLVSESGISAGVRRIEGVTGAKALALFDEAERCVAEVAAVVKGSRDNVVDKVQQLLEKQRKLEKELVSLKAKMASAAGSDLASEAQNVNGIKVIASQLDGADMKTLDNTVSQLTDKLGTAVVLLASVDGERINLACGVSKDLLKQYRAGDLMKHFAPLVGGKGGGKPEKAKGAGSDVAALATALPAVVAWVEAGA